VELLELSATPLIRQKRMYFGDPSREESNQRDRFYPTATSQPALQAWDAAVQGYALLNCNFSGTDESEVAEFVIDVADTAYAQLDTPNPPLRSTDGIMTETANGCLAEIDAIRAEPCYEYVGASAYMDPFAAEQDFYHDVEIGTFTSFGDDCPNCFCEGVCGTLVDPRGAGAATCWDLDGNAQCDASSEDQNGDGLCTPADCPIYQSCWDDNGNGVCDLAAEDETNDGLCNADDCTQYEQIVCGGCPQSQTCTNNVCQ
jgi:hypothetical protein